MNLFPKARWTIQRFWGAIAEEERRRISLKARKVRKHTRGGVRTCLVARRQVEVALRWIVGFWATKDSASPEFSEDPSACRIRVGIRRVPVELRGAF